MNQQLNLLSITSRNELIKKVSKAVDLSLAKNIRPPKTKLDIEFINDSIPDIDDLNVSFVDKQNINTTIVAVDSTCITLGFSGEDIVLASRVTAVFSNVKGPFFSMRMGPYLTRLPTKYLHIDRNHSNGYTTLHATHAEQNIRHVLEYSTLNALSKSLNNIIVLVDGALVPYHLFDINNEKLKLVRGVKNQNIDLVGFSKSSSLQFISKQITKGLTISGSPWFSEIRMPLTKSDPDVNIYVARFDDRGPPFRIDIASERTPNDVFSLLISSDINHKGYPESLRLAHHLSIFNSLETFSLKILSLGRTDVYPELGNLRLMLLGSFSPR